MKKVLLTIGTLAGGGAERVVSIWSGILAQRGYNVADQVDHRTQGEYPVDEKVHIESIAETKDDYLELSKEDIESMGKAAQSSVLDLCDDEKNIKKLIEVIEG